MKNHPKGATSMFKSNAKRSDQACICDEVGVRTCRFSSYTVEAMQ